MTSCASSSRAATPACRTRSRTTLSLNTLCGLSVADCARLMLTTETAMARRLGRVKHKIAVAGIPYRVPSDAELPERLDAVASTAYLLFTAGIAGGTDLSGPSCATRRSGSGACSSS